MRDTTNTEIVIGAFALAILAGVFVWMYVISPAAQRDVDRRAQDAVEVRPVGGGPLDEAPPLEEPPPTGDDALESDDGLEPADEASPPGATADPDDISGDAARQSAQMTQANPPPADEGVTPAPSENDQPTAQTSADNQQMSEAPQGVELDQEDLFEADDAPIAEEVAVGGGPPDEQAEAAQTDEEAAVGDVESAEGADQVEANQQAADGEQIADEDQVEEALPQEDLAPDEAVGEDELIEEDELAADDESVEADEETFDPEVFREEILEEAEANQPEPFLLLYGPGGAVMITGDEGEFGPAQEPQNERIYSLPPIERPALQSAPEPRRPPAPGEAPLPNE